MSELIFPRRMVHLDFHTGPWIPDVGVDFDPDRFAATFAEACVDSVTVFAKCHHGHLYYATDRAERHPGLRPGLDLLGQQIDALHRRGIRAPIYLSVQVDEYAATTHPEWVALDADGKQVKAGGPLAASWHTLDMSSPFQDYVAEQLQEVLDRFAPVDGIFLDMCWDQPSTSVWAIRGMQRRGYDPRDPEARKRYAREVAHEYMGRYRDMLEAAQQGTPPAGVWFNSRPKTALNVERQYLRHVEIEALPTGGWGYSYFPYVARFVRPLGLPTLSHTGRFFKSWGDNASLKPEMALKYECCQILSQGMTSGVGDLLHPRGVASPAVYDLIGKVYRHVEACEPYVEGGELLSEIALVVDPELGDRPGPSGFGATRALQQLRQQFDVVPPDADLSGYELVLIPETTRVGNGLRESLRAFVAAGGGLVVCGPAALDENGQPVLEELGIATHGASPYSHTFLRASAAVSAGLAEYDAVMYEGGFRMTPAAGAESLVGVVEPYFERAFDHFSGHSYTPPDRLSEYSAVVRNGRAITFSVPILEAFGKHAPPNYKTLLGNCLDLLLPEPLLRAGGPSKLETTVVRKGSSLVVQLLSFSPERRAEGLDIVEDALPLVEAPISVRVERQPRRVFLFAGTEEQELPFDYRNGRVHTGVTVLGGHALLVIEL